MQMMELQPLPDHTVRLFVTTRGEPAHRFAVCVQGNDSIAEVREVLQHALRVLPDFPQEASITTIEFEYDGHDYVLTDLIRVNEMFGTGSAKLKVRVDICQGNKVPFSVSESAGGQKLTDQGMSPIKTIAGSPAKSPFVRRTTSPLKKNSLTEAASDDDVELIGSSNPVTSSVPVPSFSALKENAADAVKSKGYSPPCRSLFQFERSRDFAESPARTDVPTAARTTSTLPQMSSLNFPDFQILDTYLGKSTATPMSPYPPQRGTASFEHTEDGRTSVPDVTELPFPEPAGKPGGPSVISLEEELQQDIEQRNQDTGATAEEQGTPQKGKLHNNSHGDKLHGSSGISLEEDLQQDMEQRNQDTGATASEQGTPHKGKLPSNSPEDGLGGPSGTNLREDLQQEIEQGNQGSGDPAPKQQTPKKPSKIPQEFTTVSQMGEDQPAPIEPTGSQDTNASCETASQPYKKPSKRKPGADCSELNGSFGNGAPHSPPTWKRKLRPDYASTAMHSAPSTGGQLGDAITLNGEVQIAEERLDLPSKGAEGSHVILSEVPDTIMSTVTGRQANGDGRRRKKRKSKRNKQDRGDEQPVNAEEPEGATAPVENPSLSEQVGGSNGKENGSLMGEPLQASQEEEHRSKPVTEGIKLLTQDSEHPEHTPISKKRRRLTKKHSSLHSDEVEGFLFTDTLTPKAADGNAEGSKALVAFVEEEHMPTSIAGSAVPRQDDNRGSKLNETVQDRRLPIVATPLRSSPRKLKPVSGTAPGNEVEAAQDNHEKPSADSSDDNTRLEEKAGKRKRKKGTENGKKKKKGEEGRSRQTGSHRKEMEVHIDLSDSHEYSPNDVYGEDELSDGAKRVTPRRNRKLRDKSIENKPAPDSDPGRVPCRYMLLGCQKTYTYKTSAYYLHARSCVYKGDCPSP